MLHHVDDASTELAQVIGARIKAERTARRWTLDQLADVSEVSRRMVVNVEQGAVNPSVGTLLRLSDALGIALAALVERPAQNDLTVVHAGDGAALWTSDAGGRGVLLVSTNPPDVVELWDWTLPAGDRYDSRAHTSGTRELLQVLKGAVDITAAGRTVTLTTGDAATFHGDTDHSYANPGRGAARFTLTVYEPGVGKPATQ